MLSTSAVLPRVASQDGAAARLGDPGLLIVDLGTPAAFLRGHLPGAARLDYADLVSSQGRAGGLLAPAADLSAALGAIGFTLERQVLAYDDEGGGRAARLLWTLDELGAPAGALLDGGMGQWARSSLPLERGDADVNPHYLELSSTGVASADRDYVLGHIEDPTVVILDVRSPAEYSGEDTRADRGGHIPGAVNYDWRQAVSANGQFKAAEQLREEMRTLGVTPDKEVIVHCQTHHRSSHTYCWLRWLGFERVRGYPGSWSEWGNDPDVPVRRGTAP